MRKVYRNIFFEYIDRAHTLCRNRISEDCYNEIISSFEDVSIAGVRRDEYSEQKYNLHNDARKIYISSWENVSENKDNYIYAEAAKEWQRLGIHVYPSISINQVSLRGRLTPDNIFEAICASFMKEPKECMKWQTDQDIKFPRYQHNGIDVRTLIFLMLGLLVLNICIIAVYRKRLANEMQKEMD